MLLRFCINLDNSARMAASGVLQSADDFDIISLSISAKISLLRVDIESNSAKISLKIVLCSMEWVVAIAVLMFALAMMREGDL